ncbi:MAG: hypothetical protein ACXWOL_16685 [Ktedonobacteraceae bacterium]
MKSKNKDVENLERLFVSFGKAILNQLEVMIQKGYVPVLPYMKVSFKEFDECIIKLESDNYDYQTLFHMHRIYGFFLAPGETEYCARKLWEAGILRYPSHHRIRDEDGNIIDKPSFDQDKGRFIEELLFSISDFCERYNTFHPSNKQLIIMALGI